MEIEKERKRETAIYKFSQIKRRSIRQKTFFSFLDMRKTEENEKYLFFTFLTQNEFFDNNLRKIVCRQIFYRWKRSMNPVTIVGSSPAQFNAPNLARKVCNCFSTRLVFLRERRMDTRLPSSFRSQTISSHSLPIQDKLNSLRRCGAVT